MIPELPTRPGTLWSTVNSAPPHLRCSNCGKDYNAHGAPVDVADGFGIDRAKRHLICPASDEAWAEFQRRRQITTVEKTIEVVWTDLQRFSYAEQVHIVTMLASKLGVYRG